MEYPIKLSLDEQRTRYKNRRFLAMPIAGLMMWLITGIIGLVATPTVAVWGLFICTGSIPYLGMFVSKYTGENFLDRKKPKNEFDQLFFYTVGMALLVYAIAIPFFLVDYSSLPLTVGILTGMMWMPLTWAIEHWVGLFHSLVRTGSITIIWFLFPDLRFILIPFLIVGIYCISIIILENRYRQLIQPDNIVRQEHTQSF